MSRYHLLRRALLAVVLAASAVHPASAQPPAPDAVPEFVPYVNDLQMFDQPDLSPYGRGPRRPAGWFGSAEYLSWSQVAPKRSLIGNPGVTLVTLTGAETENTGDVQLVPTLGVVSLANSIVTNSGGTVETTTTMTFLFTDIIVGPIGPSAPISSTAGGTVVQGFLEQRSTLDTTFMSSSDFTSGGRFEFGRTDEDGDGWMVSGFSLAEQAPNYTGTYTPVNFENSPVGFLNFGRFDVDLDHDGIMGRFGADTGTATVLGNPAVLVISEPMNGIPDTQGFPSDYDDTVPLATRFRTLTVENHTTTYGAELMRIWQVGLGPRGGIWEMFLGPRGVCVDDEFVFDGRSDDTATATQTTSPGSGIGTTFSTRAQNYVFGGQLGGRWSRQVGRLQVGVEGRLLAAANYQHVTQQGSIGALAGIDPNAVINVKLPARFSSTVNQTEFAPGGELRMNLKYQLFRSLYVQGGYTALYVDNIARGSQMTHYSLPTMGITAEENKSGFLLHGLNIGVVFNR